MLGNQSGEEHLICLNGNPEKQTGKWYHRETDPAGKILFTESISVIVLC